MDNQNKNYTVARESDGTIQITFTIPKELISENQSKALEEMGKDVEVPGFRKGNAPIDKVKENVPREKIVEKTLMGILPIMLSDVLKEEKIKPSIYPKFELISSEDDQDWQVRALMCEIVPFDLGDYKTQLKGLLNSSKIWTPDKIDEKDKEKEPTREEREQKIVDFLLSTTDLTIPKILIDEEVNSRLSQLLARIEKLGLTLDGYLSSIGKNPQSLRDEYAKQSESAIRVELILEKISSVEKLEIKESEIEDAVRASSSDPKIQENLNSPDQKRLIKTILLRRKALDFLLTLL